MVDSSDSPGTTDNLPQGPPAVFQHSAHSVGSMGKLMSQKQPLTNGQWELMNKCTRHFWEAPVCFLEVELYIVKPPLFITPTVIIISSKELFLECFS